MTDRPRILFVDDEPHILQALRRALHSLSREWSMQFAPSGEAALDVMAAQPVDVVVTDMRMPGMDGAALLDRVREQWPAVTRIVLSGYSEQEGLVRAVNAAHQYLAKPCDAELLQQAVRRSLRLREFIADSSLRTLIAGLNHLPSLPELYVEISRTLSDPQCTAAQIGELVAKDVAFSLKLLQVVNSAFFGVPRSVTDPTEAVVLLGTELVRAIVLGAKVFSAAQEHLGETAEIRALWQHGTRVAHLARELAKRMELPRKLGEAAFLAGFVHELGWLVLLENLPEECRRCNDLIRGGTAVAVAEASVFGVTRNAVSAALLSTWGLPDPVVEAVAFAREPGNAATHALGPLTALHLAEAFAGAGVDHEYIGRLGIETQVEQWAAELGATQEKGVER